MFDMLYFFHIFCYNFNWKDTALYRIIKGSGIYDNVIREGSSNDSEYVGWKMQAFKELVNTRDDVKNIKSIK